MDIDKLLKAEQISVLREIVDAISNGSLLTQLQTFLETEAAHVGTGIAITPAPVLQVDGAVIVSDGAGGTLAKFDTINVQRVTAVGADVEVANYGNGTRFDGVYYGTSIAAAATVTLATITPSSNAIPVVVKIIGEAIVAGTAYEVFEVIMARRLGISSLVSFTSHGTLSGSAFLSSGDFTMADSGSDVIIRYTNNEASEVYLVASVSGVFR